jgi:hypothetical protein
MKTYAFLLFLLLTFLAGCAPGYYHPGPTEDYYPGEEQYGIPRYWYDSDPTMRHWYVPPYFDPHRPY